MIQVLIFLCGMILLLFGFVPLARRKDWPQAFVCLGFSFVCLGVLLQ